MLALHLAAIPDTEITLPTSALFLGAMLLSDRGMYIEAAEVTPASSGFVVGMQPRSSLLLELSACTINPAAAPRARHLHHASRSEDATDVQSKNIRVVVQSHSLVHAVILL